MYDLQKLPWKKLYSDPMWALAMYPINYQVILTLLCGWCRECYNHGNERYKFSLWGDSFQ